MRRCPLPSLSIPALPPLPLSSHRALCALAQSSQGWERGHPLKKGNRWPKYSDTCFEFLSVPCVYIKMPCPGRGREGGDFSWEGQQRGSILPKNSLGFGCSCGREGHWFQKMYRDIHRSTFPAQCISPHCLIGTDAPLPSERELSPELLQFSSFAYTACQPNSSQDDSVWLTRVTVITVQGDMFAIRRKPWVKVQLTFKAHQSRQRFAEVKCKANLWMGQLIISILMNQRCAHSLFFHFQVLINSLVIINWNSTFIEKWHFINIKLCY